MSSRNEPTQRASFLVSNKSIQVLSMDTTCLLLSKFQSVVKFQTTSVQCWKCNKRHSNQPSLFYIQNKALRESVCAPLSSGGDKESPWVTSLSGPENESTQLEKTRQIRHTKFVKFPVNWLQLKTDKRL